jgi:predicted aspartyl protease
MAWSRFAFAFVILACATNFANAGKRTVETAANEMAVEVYGRGLLVARGSVNGIGDVRFLLDTGATNSSIDRSLAERLALPGQPAEVISFANKLSLTQTTLDEITFGPERFEDARVMIEDLGYLSASCSHVDGVIGLDLLRKKNFLVDFGRKRVIFEPGSGAGMHSAPMRVDERLVTVQVELDGRTVWMVADSGTPGTVIYEAALKDMAANYRLEGAVDAQTLGGPIQILTGIVPRLRIGGMDLNREVALVNTLSAPRPSGVSGYLGLASLGAKQVEFNFATYQLLWKR